MRQSQKTSTMNRLIIGADQEIAEALATLRGGRDG